MPFICMETISNVLVRVPFHSHNLKATTKTQSQRIFFTAKHHQSVGDSFKSFIEHFTDVLNETNLWVLRMYSEAVVFNDIGLIRNQK